MIKSTAIDFSDQQALKPCNRDLMILKDGLNPLHEACFRSKLEVAEALIKYGADVNGANKSKDTPLYFAAKKQTMPIISLLCGNGGIDMESLQRGWNVSEIYASISYNADPWDLIITNSSLECCVALKSL